MHYKLDAEYTEGMKTYDDLADRYTETAMSPPNRKNRNQRSHRRLPLFRSILRTLPAACKDVVAWIDCEDTLINDPIVQNGDNNYYLRRLLNGQYNLSGTLFIDYRNQADFSDWNTIIYGHNMNNDTMFGILPDYRKQELFDPHPVMYLLTRNRATEST